MKKRIFNKKISIITLGVSKVCILYTVDRNSGRPVSADLFSLFWFPLLYLYSKVLNLVL